jgi:hypothetical protein
VGLTSDVASWLLIRVIFAELLTGTYLMMGRDDMDQVSRQHVGSPRSMLTRGLSFVAVVVRQLAKVYSLMGTPPCVKDPVIAPPPGSYRLGPSPMPCRLSEHPKLRCVCVGPLNRPSLSHPSVRGTTLRPAPPS